MDEWGIQAQVLYPNVIAFDTHAFYQELGSSLAIECVRTYNDYLAEFASIDPKRFVPIMMIPFWDVDASVKEMHRAASIGHKGLLFAALLKNIGLENISHEMWRPILDTAQELGLSINLHVGMQHSRQGCECEGMGHAYAEGSNRTNKPNIVRNQDRVVAHKSHESGDGGHLLWYL